MTAARFNAAAYLPAQVHPGSDDPWTMAAASAAIVHDGADLEPARTAMDAERGTDPALVS